MMILGDKEKDINAVSLRAYGEQETKTMSLEELTSMIIELNLEKMPKELRD